MMLPVSRMTPMLNSLSKPLKNFNIDSHRRVDGLHGPVGNFHSLAESSLTTPLPPKSGVIGLTAFTGKTFVGSRCFAKHPDDRIPSPFIDRDKIVVDPTAQSRAYTEAKMEEIKKRLKEKGMMEDMPKKPPII